MKNINELSSEMIRDGIRDLIKGYLDKGFVPEALHNYRDENGAFVYWRARLRHPERNEKKIFPVRWNGSNFDLILIVEQSFHDENLTPKKYNKE